SVSCSAALLGRPQAAPKTLRRFRFFFARAARYPAVLRRIRSAHRPSPCGILRGQCRRRTLRSFARPLTRSIDEISMHCWIDGLRKANSTGRGRSVLLTACFGFDEMRSFWDQLFDPWESGRFELGDLIDVGE